MPIRFVVCAVLTFLLTTSGPTGAFAQGVISTKQDESLARTIRVWVSGGLGPGGYHGASGLSARASATVSVDRAVAMFRTTGSIEGVDGHTDHTETSVLAGMRFGGKHTYLIPAIGVGHAHWHDDLCTAHIICTPAQAAQFDDEGRVVAYDIGVHATRLFAGLGMNLTGVTGPGKTQLMALVFSLELGAFGR